MASPSRGGPNLAISGVCASGSGVPARDGAHSGWRAARDGDDAAMPSRYDDELWELVPEDPGPPPAHLVDFVRSLGEAVSALDIGCGDGRLSAELGAESLTVADVSSVALSRARKRLPGARVVDLEPDAPLPLADGEFDLVLCAETLEHVRDLQLLLSEIRRVLRPGGSLAVTTPVGSRATALRALVRGMEVVLDPLSPHIRVLTRRSLKALLEEHGFRVMSLRRRHGTLLAIAQR
jgi:SAM-dependent methyltransferase